MGKRKKSALAEDSPMNYTIVCPVYNEENLLPQTLPSIYALNPDEIIFGLDRCIDGSKDLILSEASRHTQTNTKIIEYEKEDGQGWAFRSAYLRRDAYRRARNDVILNTSADLRLDPEIKQHLSLIPRYALVSFGYLERNIQAYLRIIISETSLIHGFAGLLAFSKTAWENTEDLEDLKKIPRAEDTHLQQAIMSSYPTTHINTRSFHLRPNEDKIDHYHRGEAMWQQLHRSPIHVFLHSLVMVRPACFTGYCHARYHRHD